MKKLILIIISAIIFLGCETDQESGTKLSQGDTTSSINSNKVENSAEAQVSGRELSQSLKAVAVPVIKKGNCPDFYISPRGKYCIPVEGAPAIYPRQRNFPCPSGWSQQFKYCVAAIDAAAIISQISACPEGWSSQHSYCVAGNGASSAISRNRGYACPPGWSPENGYCVAGQDAPAVINKQKNNHCPFGWFEQNEYCIK